jgi:hypothetical protein
MKYYFALILILALLGCDSKKVKTVYVTKVPGTDPTTGQAIYVDESGDTVEMYQKEDFKELIESAEAQTKNSHLYSISSIKIIGVSDTTTVIVKGNLIGKDIKEEYEIILVSEMGTFTQNIDGRSFKSPHMPNGLYHIFIKKNNGVRTLIKPVNFESGNIYSLEIELKENKLQPQPTE